MNKVNISFKINKWFALIWVIFGLVLKFQFSIGISWWVVLFPFWIIPAWFLFSFFFVIIFKFIFG